MPTYTVQQIADRIHGELIGSGKIQIKGIDQLQSATHGFITFIRDESHKRRWTNSDASAALVSDDIEIEARNGRALIRVPDADLAMAVVLEMFAPPKPLPSAGIHADANIDPSAEIGANARIGPGCVIGPRVRIGQDCVLHSNVTVLDATVLGPRCELFPGVVIYAYCQLGENVTVHANSVIGADGFGYKPSPDKSGFVKIPQIGTVEIGNCVEIGACTTIDRGKFSATVIAEGTKIDNLCQIAHNCQIGRHCILAGQTALAGSVILGDGVILGGQVGIVDHVTIGQGAQIAARSCVRTDVPAQSTLGGSEWAHEISSVLREQAALRKLPNMVKTVRKLEKHLNSNSNSQG